MKLRAIRSLWLGFVLTMVFSMSACGDYSVRLPGNYALTRVYAGAVLIHHPESGVRIEANIDGYKVLNDLIVGHVTVAEHSPEKEMSKPGYFILNTKTHEVKESLDKKAWLDTLRTLGVNNEPSLGKPSRFDRDYQ
jgi:hypothetical protein